LTDAAQRKRFLEKPEEAMKDLSAEEQDMVRRLDWKALQDYGASFFCLEKLARTKGVSNPEMVAHFRGETLEAFLKTSRVPGARWRRRFRSMPGTPCGGAMKSAPAPCSRARSASRRSRSGASRMAGLPPSRTRAG